MARLSVWAFSPHFFVLGVAFLLLETRSLATFGLLFGSTWLVNSFVFFAILVSVLVAVLLALRVRLGRTRLLYWFLGDRELGTDASAGSSEVWPVTSEASS